MYLRQVNIEFVFWLFYFKKANSGKSQVKTQPTYKTCIGKVKRHIELFLFVRLGTTGLKPFKIPSNITRKRLYLPFALTLFYIV